MNKRVSSMKQFITVIFLFFLIAANASAQGNSSLSNDPYNHWDGHTHWTKYLRMSAGYMGPNSLPVPEIRKGTIDSMLTFEASAVNNYNPRDNTPNLFMRLHIPIAKNKISLELYGVPIEFYNMDSSLRFERKTFKLRGKGATAGDLYISFIINLLKNRKNLPDLALSINTRTASGNGEEEARYTDAPGYFFDLSAGKTFVLQNSSIRAYSLLGFYVWQTNIDNNPQDDAFLYGAGFDYTKAKFKYSASVNGYIGYVGNGDKPMVARTSLIYKPKKLAYKLAYQQGLHDYNYKTVLLGLIWTIGKANK